MKKYILILLTLLILIVSALPSQAMDGQALVEAAFNYMRGKSSICVVDMTIHRPDWQRTMTIKAWTKGQKESLFWIIAPPKDKGNGTLKKGKEMWVFNPKVNRVIKIPPSMMSQSWMGSDFSNNDLAKSDSLLTDYIHTITGTESHEGKKVYLVTSMPKTEAPVVWGMQKLRLREDYIMLAQEFYDEDLKLVKSMNTLQIQMLGGRMYPKVWRMQKVDEQDKYTELFYKELSFKETLADGFFTLSNLKNPRR